MANELKHGSVGTELTQAEWEGIGTHVIESQAEGDIIYASSSSQLRRLAKGTDTHVLILSSGIPAWSTSTGITAVGTIATGVWQGTDVGVAYGGTGVSTLTADAVLTGNGASAITAEANLTFDGSTLQVSAGSIDLDSQGSITNVGASGNDWTATNLTHEGSLKLTEGGAAKSEQHIYPNNTQGVSTSATLISGSGNTAGLVIVTGAKDNDAAIKFCDLVLTNSGSAAPSVLHSFDQLGSPAARTYTTSGGNLMLAMASDTYDVNLLGFQAASPL